jgi:Ca2+/Na+ antiporter
LAEWFSKTKKTIIPGTAFLFLNKVSFLLAALYCIILPILPFKLKAEVFITMLCGLILLVMYGLQGSIEAMVRDLNYSKEYTKLNITSKKVRRTLGLALFICCFILMFVIWVFSFEGYSK